LKTIAALQRKWDARLRGDDGFWDVSPKIVVPAQAGIPFLQLRGSEGIAR
jgi:hypothetical protein